MRLNRDLKILVGVACVIVAFYFGLSRLSANRDGRKLQDVQAISSNLPVFSGLRELQSSAKSGYTSAMVTRRFKCVSDCAGVNEYYAQILSANGWKRMPSADLPTGETLFRKGDLSISLSRSESSRGYDFAIDISWQSSLKGS